MISARNLLLATAGLAVSAGTLFGCGTAPIDFSGYPDKSRERLYSEGRLGGDKGLADFDLRKVWQAASGSGS
jgi:hypothetical protein